MNQQNKPGQKMGEREHRKMLKKMKFISDQDGIMNRYLREKENWQTHIQNCHRFISKSFKNPEIRSVAVLGSGWLLDLPLNHLSERFDEVLLVDIHHPAQVRKKLEKFKNVKVQELDITGGGISFAWNFIKMKNSNTSMSDPKNPLLQFSPVIPALHIDPDAIISLNILNQLDILIVDYLKSKFQKLTEDDFSSFREIIQQFHIRWITQKPGCLITDVEEENQEKPNRTSALHSQPEPGKNISRTNNNDPEKVSRHNLLHTDLPESFKSEEWVWDFDLSGFYHRDKITKMKVQSLEW